MDSIQLPDLYPEKIEVLAQINDHLNTHRMGYIKVPTGWGKTFLAKHLMRQYYDEGKAILFLVSKNNQLLTQTFYHSLKITNSIILYPKSFFSTFCSLSLIIYVLVGMHMAVKIGIIGGSGLYKMGIIKDTHQIEVDTPFGRPSDLITLGTIEGVDVVFLPRHGRGHAIPPHKINYQANIFALKECGVEYLISTAAVGSLKKEIKPLDFVIADQLIDRTAKRITTFFDDDIVAHVGFADPFCPNLSKLAFKKVTEQGIKAHKGTYICMEGPQFSTRAESNLYRSWNIDIIGMTLAPEAKLAREAEMCFSAILAVTDFDCWYEEEDNVSVSSVVDNLKKNSINMANVLKNLIPAIDYKRNCECKNSLQHAIITSKEYIDQTGNKDIVRVLLNNQVE